MKNKILVFTFFIGMFSSTQTNALVAEGGTCGTNCSWKIGNDYTLIIEPTNGDTAVMDDYEHQDDVPWKSYVPDITNIYVAEGIQNIGNYAFGHCAHGDCFESYDLEYVSLPNSLNSIGKYSFAGLKSDALVVPDSVTEVKNGAFDYISIEAMFIPEGSSWMNDGRILNPKKGTTNLEWYTKEDGGIYFCGSQEMYYFYFDDMFYDDGRWFSSLYEAQMAFLQEEGLCDEDECPALIEASSDGKILEYGGEKYASLEDLVKGNALPSKQEIIKPDGSVTILDADNNIIGFRNKKIYTIDEANQVAGKVNSFKIKYR